jgi:tetratricopeptide (TPR) repeat protein
VLRAASTLADYLGRHAEAIAYAQATVARDPHNPSAHALLGTVYLNAGRIDDSIASLRETLRQSPGFVTANVGLADALVAKGDPQGALVAVQQESGPWRLMGEAVVYHALQRNAESDAALAELTRAWPKDAAYNIAYIHAWRGEADLAFEWLETAAKNKDPGLAEVAAQRYFGSLHQDPRWLPFVRKLGMAPEQLAAIRLDVPVPSSAILAQAPAI